MILCRSKVVSSFLAGAAFCAAFISCVNPNNGISDSSDKTLRATAEIIEKETVWSDELEGTVLTQKTTGADGIDKSIEANPYCIFASGSETSYKPVHPEIVGFAKLDTSLLDKDAAATVESFCDAIVKGDDADAYMKKESMYSLVIFLYDLSQNKTDSFSSYVIGEPFDNDGILQCPVRLYYKQEESHDASVTAGDMNDTLPKAEADKLTGSAYERSLDIFLYIEKVEDSWKISQISYAAQ